MLGSRISPLLFLLSLLRPGMLFLPFLLGLPRRDSLDLPDLLYLLTWLCLLCLQNLRLPLWRKLPGTLEMRILLILPSLRRLPILLIGLRPRPLPGMLLRHSQPLLDWRPNLLSLSRHRRPYI